MPSPKLTDRIGETTTANCGMKMTIIACRGNKDVDVRFEDGQEVYHKSYGNFKKGTIAPPRDLQKERIGETTVATCGMEMTIIAYRSARDVDVRFEDGQEVHHKTYQGFKNGTIAPPQYPRHKEHIGETAVANCGMKMTIIAYRSFADLDVRFEDGQEVYHKSYGNFKKGTIAPPRDLQKERIGETTVATCGMEMTIIAYRSSLDIDVRFEDGQEAYHKKYSSFKKGAIAPPQYPRHNEHIGETAVANCGMKMTIIAYRSVKDVDIRFEDGQEVYHKEYRSFKKGKIAPPQDPRRKERIGETTTATCGMEMTIIGYRSTRDIDVRFEDGQEVYHKAYGSFKKGAIAPPQYPRHKEHIGETAVANCGMKMTIIAYRSTRDIDVRFEDGQEVHHKTYQCFKKGTIAPPQDPRHKERIGETTTATCGMKMTIIAYRNALDIDVRFEDGQESYHKEYSSFKSGNISHPQFPMKKIGKYNTLTTRYIGKIPIGEVYFIAKCRCCGEVYAGTPQMIIAANHKCKEKNCAKPKTH